MMLVTWAFEHWAQNFYCYIFFFGFISFHKLSYEPAQAKDLWACKSYNYFSACHRALCCHRWPVSETKCISCTLKHLPYDRLLTTLQVVSPKHDALTACPGRSSDWQCCPWDACGLGQVLYFASQSACSHQDPAIPQNTTSNTNRSKSFGAHTTKSIRLTKQQNNTKSQGALWSLHLRQDSWFFLNHHNLSS